jgi:hypothetical protein
VVVFGCVYVRGKAWGGGSSRVFVRAACGLQMCFALFGVWDGLGLATHARKHARIRYDEDEELEANWRVVKTSPSSNSSSRPGDSFIHFPSQDARRRP